MTITKDHDHHQDDDQRPPQPLPDLHGALEVLRVRGDPIGYVATDHDREQHRSHQHQQREGYGKLQDLEFDRVASFNDPVDPIHRSGEGRDVPAGSPRSGQHTDRQADTGT